MLFSLQSETLEKHRMTTNIGQAEMCLTGVGGWGWRSAATKDSTRVTHFLSFFLSFLSFFLSFFFSFFSFFFYLANFGRANKCLSARKGAMSLQCKKFWSAIDQTLKGRGDYID